jgi:hypothetical protein
MPQAAAAYKKKEAAEKQKPKSKSKPHSMKVQKKESATSSAIQSSTCRCHPLLQESPFITCTVVRDNIASAASAGHLKIGRVSPMDSGEKQFATGDHEFKSLLPGAHQCKAQHRHGKIKRRCKCCECDTRNQPLNIVDLGRGWYWTSPPFLQYGGGQNFHTSSVAECKQACAQQKGCRAGTFVTSLDGRGQCWLSGAVRKTGAKCVEQCDSFGKLHAGAEFKFL